MSLITKNSMKKIISAFSVGQDSLRPDIHADEDATTLSPSSLPTILIYPPRQEEDPLRETLEDPPTYIGNIAPGIATTALESFFQSLTIPASRKCQGCRPATY
jgi:hypothetical protein